MAHRVVHSHFEKFSQARLAFVRAIADSAERPEYMEALIAEDVFTVLRPMLHDKVSTVSSTAALAVGRIAGTSVELAHDVVKSGLLEDIVATMVDSPSAQMKAGAFVFRSLAKHNSELAGYVLSCGVLSPLLSSLRSLEGALREAAAAAIAILASHTPAQAQQVAESGVLPLLVAATMEPEPALKRAAAAALTEVAQHNEELAYAVTVAGAIPQLVKMLQHADVRVRKAGGATLVAILKHSAALANAAVEAKLFPTVLLCMQDPDSGMRKVATSIVRDVVKHSEDLAHIAAAGGALHNIMEYMTTRARGGDRLPGTLALGFIASYSDVLANQVVQAGGVGALKDVLLEDGEDHLRAAAIWSIGQVGKHDATCANAVAGADLLRHILEAMKSNTSSDDLREKARRCLNALFMNCTHILALQNLLTLVPTEFIATILSQICGVLRDAVEQRRAFLASGGLKLIQGVDVSDPEIGASLDGINALYPAEVVAYLQPTFMAGVADRLIK